MAVLIINPITDDDFAAFVHACARDASDPTELQANLRERYPRAIARSRDLDGEGRATWYVYRDGHWVRTGG